MLKTPTEWLQFLCFAVWCAVPWAFAITAILFGGGAARHDERAGLPADWKPDPERDARLWDQV